MTSFNTDILDNLIIGRIEPHIYAFTTNTVPNYLKVGDTYRSVNVRLDEWRDYFPNLEHESDWEWLAKTQSGKYFRDFAIHYYLETIKRFHRLQPTDFDNLPYYSKEFFENATSKDVDEAIQDIEQYAALIDGSRQYQFYSEDRLPEKERFAPTETYEPRPNQIDTIKRFVAARKKGHKNLLMYAVMRFGKSFTSMCCAVEMNAKIVLIVSAKADVNLEWQKTVQSHTRFSSFDFLDSEDLKENNAISKKLEEGKRVVVFLTLQDLMGDDIKRKHRDLFRQKVDLLIVDETHFGARAEEYGKVLRNVNNLKVEQIRKEQEKSGESTFDDLEKGLENIKSLNVDTTLHLSGTPYRILMGSEFKPDDIIAFYQFTDIIDDKEEWDSKHQEDIEQEVVNPDTGQPYQEWDNPYYGFPQMIRFAFNPNNSARRLMEQLKSEGKTTQLNELFRPQSIAKNSTEKKNLTFIHEKEVLNLMRVIDGCEKDEDLLGFLDYDKLKEGKMCRHIVMVLPFCASCDAMEKLINDHKNEFKNLCDYTLVNIAGHKSRFDTTEEIKAHIKQLESENKKSITLTVNRMLTGSTVREWDTMIFLKDVSSPQEYDQAIFRLQNQYVTTYKDDVEHTIKYNMKPQTLLVDFDPNRMFRMQERKSMISVVNKNDRGNDELEKRIKRELEISPIIVFNHRKIAEITPTDIMDAVRDYSANLTVMDEASDVPVDFELLNDPNLLEFIKDLDPINNKKGINVKSAEGEGEDYDLPDDDDDNNDDDNDDDDNDESKEPNRNNAENNKSDDKLDKRLATFFAQILFFALLTDDQVKSLNEVVEAIRRTDENQRIMRNVGLKLEQLLYVKKHINPQILNDLDYKIQNTNDLLRDTTHEPLERVERALKKFGRLSTSEIVTPTKVADEMVALLPEENINAKTRFLDIASKQGEFACALYKRFVPIYGSSIKDNIYALPTSKLTYEFTYKVFKLLDIPTKNIFETFNTYDLIGENKETYIQILKDMNFDVIIGNPPYNVMDGGAQASATPIYNLIVSTANLITARFSSFIIPSRWYAGGKGAEIDSFREEMLDDEHLVELHDFTHPEDVFPNTNNRGGVCYFLRDKTIVNNNCITVVNHGSDDIVQVESRPLRIDGVDIFIRSNQSIGILDKIVKKTNANSWMEEHVSAAKAFGLRTFFIRDPRYKKSPLGLSNPIKCYGRGGSIGYIERDVISSHLEWIDLWKVYVPESNNIGTELNDDNQNALVGPPKTICTETYLVVGADLGFSESGAKNCVDYLKTKFARFLLSLAKVSQHGTGKTYRFVPLQDFSKSWTDEMLYKKYDLTQPEIDYIEAMIKPME